MEQTTKIKKYSFINLLGVLLIASFRFKSNALIYLKNKIDIYYMLLCR